MMSERARIIAWWGYVLCVLVVFEATLQFRGFAPALGAALVSIVVLGSLLKFAVARLAGRAKRRAPGRPQDGSASPVDSPGELRP